MFVDYLAITFKVPPVTAQGKKLPPGHLVADQVINLIRVAGDARPHGATFAKLAQYPDGTLVKLDFGGSVLPIDLSDFVRWARRYRGWTISRLDLADNVVHASRDKVRVGQANHVRWFYEASGEGGKVQTFTGCTLGKRGGCGSYYRLYDARKHLEGRVAKLARFGTDQFWRTEYELPREWLRRRGLNTVDQLDEELLSSIWRNEVHSKGLQYDATAEYCSLRPRRCEDELAQELKQDRRVTSILQQARKLELMNLALVVTELARMQGLAVRAGLDPAEGVVPPWELLERSEATGLGPSPSALTA